jgi:hypothetical protein
VPLTKKKIVIRSLNTVCDKVKENHLRVNNTNIVQGWFGVGSGLVQEGLVQERQLSVLVCNQEHYA